MKIFFKEIWKRYVVEMSSWELTKTLLLSLGIGMGFIITGVLIFNILRWDLLTDIFLIIGLGWLMFSFMPLVVLYVIKTVVRETEFIKQVVRKENRNGQD